MGSLRKITTVQRDASEFGMIQGCDSFSHCQAHGPNSQNLFDGIRLFISLNNERMQIPGIHPRLNEPAPWDTVSV